jgi:hypothetical protein
MQYPIGKTLVIACLAMAGVTFAASTSTTNHKAAANNQISADVAPAPAPSPGSEEETEHSTTELYNELDLASNGMKPEVFETALRGFTKLSHEGKIARQDKITIVDFSQPSNQKRFYVIDLDTKQLLFHSFVSHGKGSGELWAKSFSNTPSSYRSSPGFYVTQETYNGGHGYSLRLDGLENGINDNARNRAIVMHGAPYANESSIDALGFLGRSQGCPALPLSIYKPVISTIKDGTCLFIYTPDHSYLDRSPVLS